MTDLIVIDDISDELPPAFMILDDESCQNITAIFSFDKTKNSCDSKNCFKVRKWILQACSQSISEIG